MSFFESLYPREKKSTFTVNSFLRYVSKDLNSNMLSKVGNKK